MLYQKQKKKVLSEAISPVGQDLKLNSIWPTLNLENINKLTEEHGNRHSFTVQKYFEVHKLTKGRLYLPSSNVDDLVFSGSQLQWKEDKGRLWRKIYTAEESPVDSENSKQQRQDEERLAKEKRLIEELELDEKERLEALRKIREERIPPEPAKDTSTRIKACVNH